MIPTVEQLAAEFQPLAAAGFTPLPPPPPSKPAPARPAAAGAPAAPAAPPPPPPPPPSAVQIASFADKGFHLEAVIEPSKVVEAARIMDRHGFAIDAVTGMDWPAQDLMEVIYDFLHFQTGMRAAFRARIPRSAPRIDTISNVYSGAEWHERETHDMFGIEFTGNRDLSPFILPDDADFHPLRKDYNP